MLDAVRNPQKCWSESAEKGILLLDEEDMHDEEDGKRQFIRRRVVRFRGCFNSRLSTIVVILFGLLIFMYHMAGKINISTPRTNQTLHLLLPASSTDVNLCKILLSASVLGYPTPVLINWKAGHEAPNNTKLPHTKKLDGVIDYIKSLKPEQSQDIVLMVDAFDIWFQLGPEVMLARYHAVNREADRRLAAELGSSENMRSNGLHNSVIMASDKFCYTLEGAWCWLMPESPLSPETLGKETAPLRMWIYNQQTLPRYLNTGFIMGPAAEVRAIFERAVEYIHQAKVPLTSDQHYVSMVFAEQQLQRSIIQRQVGRAPHAPLPPAISDPSDATTEKQRQQQEKQREELTHLALLPNRPYEFGIHLDYSSSLTHTAIRSHFDHKFLYYNTTPVHPALDLDPIYDCKSQVAALPADISSSPTPFHPLNTSDADAARSWADIPLYTDICTGTIPATLHHNGDKGMRERLWTKFWMQPRAGDLLAGLQARDVPSSPKTRDTAASGDRVVWREGSMIKFKDGVDAEAAAAEAGAGAGGSTIGPGGALGDGGEKLSWDDLCARPEFEEELFREK